MMMRIVGMVLSGSLALVMMAGAASATSEDCPGDADRIALFESIPDPPPFVLQWLPIMKFFYANDCVDLNEIQVLGTHNSYHREPSPALFDFLFSVTPLVEAWEYSHLPLAEQLQSQGIRQLELDVFLDPDGGKFIFRLGPLLVEESPIGPLPLLLPGLKVLHVPHFDFETTCTSLIECLLGLKGWSDANPLHLPVMILVEAKSGEFGEGGVPFTAADFDVLDAELRLVFPEAELFTPDDLRGEQATLEAAVLNEGWPTLGELRGQVLFALDNAGDDRLNYLQGHPSLEGRVMFTNSVPGQPDAAFVKVNDPLANPTLIPDLVASGYIVRTRADSDSVEARSGDTVRRDAALASGAQFVSTDFPVPSPKPGFSDYFVQIPDGSPARCNPVASPVGCRNDSLEILP